MCVDGLVLVTCLVERTVKLIKWNNKIVLLGRDKLPLSVFCCHLPT
jgi:hypothetical protein